MSLARYVGHKQPRRIQRARQENELGKPSSPHPNSSYPKQERGSCLLASFKTNQTTKRKQNKETSQEEFYFQVRQQTHEL